MGACSAVGSAVARGSGGVCSSGVALGSGDATGSGVAAGREVAAGRAVAGSDRPAVGDSVAGGNRVTVCSSVTGGNSVASGSTGRGIGSASPLSAQAIPSARTTNSAVTMDKRIPKGRAMKPFGSLCLCWGSDGRLDSLGPTQFPP